MQQHLPSFHITAAPFLIHHNGEKVDAFTVDSEERVASLNSNANAEEEEEGGKSAPYGR
jgi:hypothetical protein